MTDSITVSNYTFLLLGPPGSGKSSLTHHIFERFPRVKSFGVRRQALGEMSRGTTMGKEIEEIIYGGRKPRLLPLRVVKALYTEFMSTTSPEDLLIIEGFPINSDQAEILKDILVAFSRSIDLIVILDCQSDQLQRRIASRRTCYNCVGKTKIEIIHALDKDTCSRCGTRLSKRFDDTPEWTEERIKLFRKISAFLLSYFSDILFFKINANQSMAEVHRDFDQIIKNYSATLSRLANIKAIGFDVDDTLVSTFEVGWLKIQDVVKSLGLKPLTKEAFKRAYGSLGFDQCIAEWFPTVDLKVFKMNYYNASTLYPYQPLLNFKEIASYLRRVGILSGIITNGKHEKTIAKLAATKVKITDLDFAYYDETMTSPKPNPDSFFSALDRLNVEDHEFLYVGDSMTDWKAAKSANVGYLAVDTGPQNWRDMPLDSMPMVIPSANNIRLLLDRAKAFPYQCSLVTRQKNERCKRN